MGVLTVWLGFWRFGVDSDTFGDGKDATDPLAQESDLTPLIVQPPLTR
jgi:hypothetical protein